MKLKIISDGTNEGTKLVDEDSGELVPLVQKLTWEAKADGFHLTKVTIELLNVPVEIVAKADVDLFEVWPKQELVKSFEKEIKIVSEPKTLGSSDVKIFDNQTQETVGAIQEIKWEANCLGHQKAKIKKIKFDKKDW